MPTMGKEDDSTTEFFSVLTFFNDRSPFDLGFFINQLSLTLSGSEQLANHLSVRLQLFGLGFPVSPD